MKRPCSFFLNLASVVLNGDVHMHARLKTLPNFTDRCPYISASSCINIFVIYSLILSLLTLCLPLFIIYLSLFITLSSVSSSFCRLLVSLLLLFCHLSWWSRSMLLPKKQNSSLDNVSLCLMPIFHSVFETRILRCRRSVTGWHAIGMTIVIRNHYQIIIILVVKQRRYPFYNFYVLAFLHYFFVIYFYPFMFIYFFSCLF